ncbi:MAG: hypothetical protein ABIO86_17045 [Sphingomonas sp.]
MNGQRRAYATGAVQDDLADVIGQAATTRLIEALGGTRIYVPRTCGVHHPITVAIGVKAAAMLVQTYTSMWLDLPKPHLRRARALEAALAARNGDSEMTIAEVALSFDYTERWIYQMLADHDKREGAANDQPDLFA